MRRLRLVHLALALSIALACRAGDGSPPAAPPCASDADCSGSAFCAASWCTTATVRIVAAPPSSTRCAEPVAFAWAATVTPPHPRTEMKVLLDGEPAPLTLDLTGAVYVVCSRLAEGEHSLEARIEVAGHTVAAEPVLFTVDRTRPSLVAQRPRPGESELPAQPFVEFEYSEPLRLDEATCATRVTDSRPYPEPAACTLSPDGRTVRVETPTLYDLRRLEVSVPAVRDLAGNASLPASAEWTQPPLAVSFSIAQGPRWPWVSGTVQIEIEVAGGTPDRVEVHFSGVDFVTIPVPGPPYVWEWDTTTFPEGYWSVWARAWRGTRSGGSSEAHPIVDRTPPRVTWLGPVFRADPEEPESIWVRDAILVQISEAIDVFTFEPSMVSVTDAAGEPVPVRIELDHSRAVELRIFRSPIPAVPSTVHVELLPTLTDRAGLSIVPATGTWLQPEWLSLGTGYPLPGRRLDPGGIVTQRGAFPSMQAIWVDTGPGVGVVRVGWPDDSYSGEILNVDSTREARAPRTAGDLLDSTASIYGPTHVWLERDSGGTWRVQAARRNSRAPFGWFRFGGPLPAGPDPSDPAVASADRANPAFAWTEPGTAGRTVRVVRWDETAWDDLGAPDAGGVTGGPALALDPGAQPIVAWTEAADALGPAQMLVRRWTGTAWAAVEGPLNAEPSAPASAPDLAVDAEGHPALAWVEGNAGARAIRAARWDGAAWIPLGGPGSDPGTESLDPSVRVDGAGAIVVAYVEAGSSGRAARVARWRDGDWERIASPASAGHGVPGRPVMALDRTGLPHVAWSDDAGNLRSVCHNE